ncbi:MAG TPA: hypothetical protein VIJ27_09450 [Mucilaginibacter sp.]
MTDESIIYDTIRFINGVIEPPIIFANVKETIWWNFDNRKKEHLRRLLLNSGFVNQNMRNKWEFRLTAAGDITLGNGNKLLEIDFLKYIQRQPDIELFMIEHFIKPNPKLKSTNHKTDTGVNFLIELKKCGFVNYDKNDLLHISNDWYEDPPYNTKKRWFDTVDINRPFHVHLEDLGKNYLLLEDNHIKTKRVIKEETMHPTSTNHAGTGLLNKLKKATIWIAKNIILVIILAVLSGVIVLIISYFILPWFKHNYPTYDVK